MNYSVTGLKGFSRFSLKEFVSLLSVSLFFVLYSRYLSNAMSYRDCRYTKLKVIPRVWIFKSVFTRLSISELKQDCQSKKSWFTFYSTAKSIKYLGFDFISFSMAIWFSNQLNLIDCMPKKNWFNNKLCFRYIWWLKK